MAIRYDEGLLDDIRKTVKNYQAKRQRVLNKGGNIIPDPAYVANFLNDYTDRRQLIRDLKKLQRYSIKGAEEEVTLDNGLVTTNYQLGEVKRLKAQAKRNITKELKQAGDLRLLQPLARSHYENLQLRYQYLSRPLSSLSKRQFFTYERIAYGEGELYKKQQTLYNNIMTMVEDISNAIDPSVMTRFREALETLSVKELADLVSTNSYMSGIISWYEVMQAGGETPNLNEQVIGLTNYINISKINGS